MRCADDGCVHRLKIVSRCSFTYLLTGRDMRLELIGRACRSYFDKHEALQSLLRRFYAYPTRRISIYRKFGSNASVSGSLALLHHYLVAKGHSIAWAEQSADLQMKNNRCFRK